MIDWLIAMWLVPDDAIGLVFCFEDSDGRMVGMLVA